ncbi:Histone deacetylase 1 [Carabus blaptoides fortunei]
MNNVVYIFDNNLCAECDRLPVIIKRASIVHDLINSYGLLQFLNMEESIPATEDDLKLSHSSYYIDFLKIINESNDLDQYYEEQEDYGLGYDCPILERMYDFARTIAGSSLTAANLLISGKYKIAINWFGGWHHAQRDGAEGFCYINDIAIAIQKLSESFKRILYIDFDVHHGNGVQNLFESSQRILTLSFHKCMSGFYPGSGTLSDLGFSKGKYYSLNIPFLEGISDNTLLYTFNKIFPRINEVFQPHAIVVQCGADGLRGDPIGQCNLTPKSVGTCVEHILNLQLPTLFLGGGGYNFPNTARHWTYLTSIIVGQNLPVDIPDESEYFTKYGPDFELDIPAGNLKDTNSVEYLDNIIDTITETRSSMRRAFSNEELREFKLRRVFLLAVGPQDSKYDDTYNAILHENARFADLIQGNFKEAYRNLTYKHIMGLNWAATYCSNAKYVIKMDDDIVFNMYKILDLLHNIKLPQEDHIAGYILNGMVPIREPANKWFVTNREYRKNMYPPFVSGWFYITTPKVAGKLAHLSEQTQYFWIDDVYVTGILAKQLKIKHYNLNKIYAVHSEYLECCVRDLKVHNYECDLLIGPNGGDSNMFFTFNRIMSKCLHHKCIARPEGYDINSTCVAERKTRIGKGKAIIESIQLF